MDPVTLAAAALGLLSPYLAKAGEAAAKEIGEAAWEKMKAIYTLVRNKLAGDAYAEQTLKRLEADPTSDDLKAALRAVLKEKIAGDASFDQALRGLLDEARAVGAETINQRVDVSGQARTGDITQVGKVEGDLSQGKPR
jgi:hypothetical protein